VAHGMNWECLPAIRLFEAPYRCAKNDNKQTTYALFDILLSHILEVFVLKCEKHDRVVLKCLSN
jgi:hypothetical protein